MMATKKIRIGEPEITTSTVVSWSADFYALELKVRFLKDITLMHSCTETHTYVLDASVVNGDELPTNIDHINLLWDLHQMNEEALPFGQIVFLSYHSDGKFGIESATERWLPTKVGTAFKSFGYSDTKIIENFVHVSEKDKFKLKLKFGY